ncbi:high mobility group protein 20A [Diabrotica virgifera virgifera]|uniref:High mobility group protein 20A-like n=1 Tax=Diabrotica virgifera virgifera TaxID=50390 RepID=A0A6P7F0K4_DIAVI|nr:high mobility group protein 20A [Diabrotica virgifera virgifera]XP_028128408.1 high mobility group protein 20A [Diabrotica virgifera virgifera]
MEEVSNTMITEQPNAVESSASTNSKIIENPENTLKPKVLKAKKRKKPKDSTAPRVPLTGYVRYLNDRREAVRSTNPNLTFADITKMLASEWSNLPVNKKQQYLDAAEQDRERYTKEYNAYKQTEAYKIFTQQQNEKKIKEVKEKEDIVKIPNLAYNNHPGLNKDQQDVDYGNFDIPIFTEEFLDHNKTRDTELRQLRKINIDFEQQNAILSKHIENMKMAISKLEFELIQQEKNNLSLNKHLNHLKNTLIDGFGGTVLPGIKDVATIQNIDNYMTNLHSILLENSSSHSNLLQVVRDIVGKLEFNG